MEPYQEPPLPPTIGSVPVPGPTQPAPPAAPPEAHPGIWGPWPTIGLGIAIFVIWLIGQTLGLVAAAAIQVATTNMTFDELGDVEALEAFSESGLVLAWCTLIATPVGIGAICGAIKLKEKASLREYLSLRRLSPGTILRLLAGTAAFIALADALSIVLGRPVVPQVMIDTYNSSGFLPVLWVAIVICAPLFEEGFFRGFLFEGLRHGFLGTRGAAAVTAALWSIIHFQYGPYEWAHMFVGGMLLAWVRIRTGSLWSCVLIHAMVNTVATIQTALISPH